MTKNTKTESAQTVPHQSNESLLFQFILSDSVLAFREMAQIKELNKALQSEDHDSAKIFDAIINHIATLSGSSKEEQRFFSWNLDSGVLTKLKNHCTLFCQSADEKDKELILLDRYANRSWLLCLQCLDILRAMKSAGIPPSKGQSRHFAQYSILYATLEKFISQMNRLARLIMRLFVKFKDEENVIFFLVRSHQDFDELFGPQFVLESLRKMFRGGLKEVEHFLITRYDSRGFENIVPLIQSKIKEIAVS